MALGSRRKTPAAAPTVLDEVHDVAPGDVKNGPAVPAVPPTGGLPAMPAAVNGSGHPPTPPAVVVPVAPRPAGADADVAELRTAVNDLQQLVSSLAERSTSAGDASETASRILVAANEAAEIALATARTEADDVIGQAKAKSVEIITVARDLADSELAAERARVGLATEAWTTHRAAIGTSLAGLDSSLTAYRADLATTAAAIAAAIAQLDAPLLDGKAAIVKVASDKKAVSDPKAAEAPALDAAKSDEQSDGQQDDAVVASDSEAPSVERAALSAAPPSVPQGGSSESAATPSDTGRRSVLFGSGIPAVARTDAAGVIETPGTNGKPAPAPQRAGLFGR